MSVIFSRATSRKVAGSIPDGVIGIFHGHNPSGRTITLGLNQPLTEMSTRNISWGVKAVGAYSWQTYHFHVSLVMKSGSLNLLGPSELVQACNGIALPLPLPILSPVKVRRYRGRAFGYSHWYSWQSNSMTDGAWNDDSAPASEKITHILWNPNIPDRIHNSPPLQNILSQINPVHDLVFCFLKTRFNIILPSSSLSSKMYFSADCLTKTLYTFIFCPQNLHVLPVS